MNGHQPKWKKPTTAIQSLTSDEWLIVDTTKLGLKITGRRADFKRAENDYDNRDFGWWTLGGDKQYENAMSEYVAMARQFRENGCPYSLSKKVGSRFKDFWYWVATRQQYEEV